MNRQGLASIPKKGNFSSTLYPAHANRIWPVRSRDGWVGAWDAGGVLHRIRAGCLYTVEAGNAEISYRPFKN